METETALNQEQHSMQGHDCISLLVKTNHSYSNRLHLLGSYLLVPSTDATLSHTTALELTDSLSLRGPSQTFREVSLLFVSLHFLLLIFT